MVKSANKNVVVREKIIKKIIFLRNEKVILDVHLSELYEVETRALKQAVRSNIDRFPPDFMFELTENEVELVVSQNVIPCKLHRALPCEIWDVLKNELQVPLFGNLVLYEKAYFLDTWSHNYFGHSDLCNKHGRNRCWKLFLRPEI